MDFMPNTTGELATNLVELSQATVLDEHGTEVPMPNLWTHETAILVFVRHFACIECRTTARQIWSERERYEGAGGRIRFIGNGQPQFIESFKEDLGLKDAPVYTDPSLNVFHAAGFKRGFLAALGPKSLRAGFKLNTEGVKKASYKKGMGDLWQLGGVLVVKPTGHVAYQYVSERLGDYPPEEDFKGQL